MHTMPNEVRRVFNALEASVKEADLPKSFAYVHYHERNDEWIVGPNIEGYGPSSVYRGGVWYYRDGFTGRDRPIPHGVEEAVEDARITFTG